ncbi:hypothetical protein B0H14DRAFT_2784403, partial [Mycena olivaceomarginata]
PAPAAPPALLLLTPAGGIRGLCLPHQRTPRVRREGRHHLRAAAVLFLPHLHTLHTPPRPRPRRRTPRRSHRRRRLGCRPWYGARRPCSRLCTRHRRLVGSRGRAGGRRGGVPCKDRPPSPLPPPRLHRRRKQQHHVRFGCGWLVSVDGDAPEEDDGDVWVDADDEDDDEGGDEDEEM